MDLLPRDQVFLLFFYSSLLLKWNETRQIFFFFISGLLLSLIMHCSDLHSWICKTINKKSTQKIWKQQQFLINSIIISYSWQSGPWWSRCMRIWRSHGAVKPCPATILSSPRSWRTRPCRILLWKVEYVHGVDRWWWIVILSCWSPSYVTPGHRVINIHTQESLQQESMHYGGMASLPREATLFKMFLSSLYIGGLL